MASAGILRMQTLRSLTKRYSPYTYRPKGVFVGVVAGIVKHDSLEELTANLGDVEQFAIAVYRAGSGVHELLACASTVDTVLEHGQLEGVGYLAYIIGVDFFGEVVSSVELGVFAGIIDAAWHTHVLGSYCKVFVTYDGEEFPSGGVFVSLHEFVGHDNSDIVSFFEHAFGHTGGVGSRHGDFSIALPLKQSASRMARMVPRSISLRLVQPANASCFTMVTLSVKFTVANAVHPLAIPKGISLPLTVRVFSAVLSAST